MMLKSSANANGAKRRDQVAPELSDQCTNCFMAFQQYSKATLLACVFALLLPGVALGQDFISQGGEYSVAGSMLGDQVHPDVSLRTSGGIVVWQDNATDGSGAGISGLRLDSSFSALFSSFRVNQQGANEQNNPRVALLSDGGAVIVWQGGRQGYQDIYARFLSSSNTWLTGDIRVNTYTNGSQLNPVVTVLGNGSVVVAWASFNQEATNSLQGVYAQRFTGAGAKVDGEFRVNQTTAFNQRLPAVTALSDGRFVMAWVSEQQRFENSVDIFARFYNASGTAAGNEFLINTSTNITGHPSVAPSSDGGFIVAWSERDSVDRSASWNIAARRVSSAGVGGTARLVNTTVFGDQIAPRVSSIGTDYLVTWMSLGQDGSREGIYGQYLRGDASHAGNEFKVNTTTVSKQMHPAVASDGQGRFLAVWTSFIGGTSSFDLYAQRYASTSEPLPAPDAPFVSVLSSNTLSLTWPVLAGFSVSNYLVYADGAAAPTALVTSNLWRMTGLAPNSTHTFRLAYVLADGRQSPLSSTSSGTTFGTLSYGGIPYDWMVQNFGADLFVWPSPFVDSDGDGVTNADEFAQGTNPANANSVLRIRLQKTAQGLYLNWNTQPSLMYQIQVSTGLGQWSNLGGMRFAAGYLDSVYLGLGSQGFYRVLRVR